MDDAQLLRRYAEEGSEAAFTELVGRHLDLVHSAALRQVGGDFHRAKDVTQLVFADLARKAAALSHHPFLVGWLHTSTYFAAVKLMRAERRRQAREEKAHLMNDLWSGPEPEIDWSRLAPMLDGVMQELSDRDRAAVIWRFFHAQSLAVLGQKLGVSETAARKRVDRALEKMHRSLSSRGIESTTAALALMLADHAVFAAPVGLAETVSANALASAAGAGAQAPWLLKFLGKSKFAMGVSGLVWIGAVVSLPLLGVAAGEFWMAWRANAALVGEREGYAAQQERFRSLNHAANGSRLPAAKLASPASSARDPKADFQKFLAAYPRARATIIANHKMLLLQIYGSFYRSAGLTPAQIEQFQSLVAENWIESMTLTPGKFILNSQPLPPEAKLRAILGGRAYQEFEDYGRIAYAHYWACIAGGFSAAASPSAGQLDQLALILVKNNPVTPPPYSISHSYLASIDWDAVTTQARGIFSDAQWKSAEAGLLGLQILAANRSLP